MAKRAHSPAIRTVEPEGEIRDLPAPVAVEFRFNYVSPFADRHDSVARGWAIAFTRAAGLVVWRQRERVASGWFPAEHIRRI